MNILKILTKTFGESRQEGRNEHLFYCPFCRHEKKKLAVNVENGKWHCWVCETRGKSPRLLIMRFASEEDKREYERGAGVDMTAETMKDLLLLGQPETQPIERPEFPTGFRTLTMYRGLSMYDRMVQNYLINRRHWTHEDILYWKVGYCREGEQSGRIVIPSFDAEGELNYYVARKYSPGGRPYDNPSIPKEKIIFNELMLDFRRELIISEGVFDCAKLGENSVPLLGSSIGDNSLLLYRIVSHGSTVVLALDADAKRKTLHVAKTLLRYGVETYIAELGEFADAGEIPDKDTARRFVDTAQPITNDNFMLWKLKWSV